MANKQINGLEAVTVKSALPREKDGGFPVAIFDKHDAYEEVTKDNPVKGEPPLTVQDDGELFIGDDKLHTVPLTPEVQRAINEGRLVRSSEEGALATASDIGGGGYNVEFLNGLNEDELRALANQENVGDTSKMKKKELVSALVGKGT